MHSLFGNKIFNKLYFMSFSEKTYGEIFDLEYMFNEIRYILFQNNLKIKDYTFYDLGSGYGKIINYSSEFVNKSIGIEIDESRYKSSLIYNSNSVSFKNKNFFCEKFNNKNIILINNLCFSIGTNKRLSLKILNECKKNDVIIVTLKLDLLKHYYLKMITLECSWGDSEIYFYLLK